MKNILLGLFILTIFFGQTFAKEINYNYKNNSQFYFQTYENFHFLPEIKLPKNDFFIINRDFFINFIKDGEFLIENEVDKISQTLHKISDAKKNQLEKNKKLKIIDKKYFHSQNISQNKEKIIIQNNGKKGEYKLRIDIFDEEKYIAYSPDGEVYDFVIYDGSDIFQFNNFFNSSNKQLGKITKKYESIKYENLKHYSFEEEKIIFKKSLVILPYYEIIINLESGNNIINLEYQKLLFNNGNGSIIQGKING